MEPRSKNPGHQSPPGVQIHNSDQHTHTHTHKDETEALAAIQMHPARASRTCPLPPTLGSHGNDTAVPSSSTRENKKELLRWKTARRLVPKQAEGTAAASHAVSDPRDVSHTFTKGKQGQQKSAL